MKIISKYKDYYDYLAYIYGIDEKIILDRRKYDPFNVHKQYGRKYDYGSICVAGIRYDFLIDPGLNFYYGKDLEKFGKKVTSNYWISRHGQHISVDRNYIDEGKYSWVRLHTEPRKTTLNEKYECPILLSLRKGVTNRTVYKYPILKDFNFGSVLTPHDIYLALSSYLAPKDQTVDNMSNDEKIQSHGFDEKSFKNTGNRLK